MPHDLHPHGRGAGYLATGTTAAGTGGAPDELIPLENLTDEELHRRAIAEREQRALAEKMTIRSVQPERPWTDYVVTSHGSGKSYRVSLRGEETGAVVLLLSRLPQQSVGHLQTRDACVAQSSQEVHRQAAEASVSTP